MSLTETTKTTASTKTSITKFLQYINRCKLKHQAEVMFSPLFKTPAFQDAEVASYLTNARGLQPEDFHDVEVYAYEGPFTYKDKEYTLPKCVVIPLRCGSTKILNGVWIRFIHEKRFFIWLSDEKSQKFWVSTSSTINPDDSLVICESIFDALSLRKLTGYEHCAALLGATCSSELASYANRNFKNIILALDNDIAGQKAQLKLLEQHSTWGILLAEDKDPLGLYGKPLSQQYKDYNEVLTRTDIESLEHKVLYGIQGKIHLKAQL